MFVGDPYYYPDEVRERRRAFLTEMRDDSRYVLFAAGTDVELRTPVDRLVVMRQTAEGFKVGQSHA